MLIAGAGGFAKELLEVIIQNNFNEGLVFYDDFNSDAPVMMYDKYPVLKNIDAARDYITNQDKRFALGVGSPLLRQLMSDKFQKTGGVVTSILSQHAKIGHFENKIGLGSTILTNAVIEAGNNIGIGCLIHNAAFISHDITIGNYCEISPAVNVLGRVGIGNHCSIGAAAVILPGIQIGNNVIIGAGSVVNTNIPDNSLAVGVPAQVIKKLNPLSF